MILFVEKKKWGSELVIENNDKYCFKKIIIHDIFSSDGKFHYHKIKDETFYVTSGFLHVDYIYPKTKKINTLCIPSGHSIRILPDTLHRFKGLPYAEFFEASTHHEDKDSIRISYEDFLSEFEKNS